MHAAMDSTLLLGLMTAHSLFGKSQQQTLFVFCEEMTRLWTVWSHTLLCVYWLQVELIHMSASGALSRMWAGSSFINVTNYDWGFRCFLCPNYVTILNVDLNYVIDRAEFLILLLIFRIHQGFILMCEVHSVKLALCCVNSILFKVSCCLWTLFLCTIKQPLYGHYADVPLSYPITVSEHWMEHWC